MSSSTTNTIVVACIIAKIVLPELLLPTFLVKTEDD